jgi:hypothetical protein
MLVQQKLTTGVLQYEALLRLPMLRRMWCWLLYQAPWFIGSS